MKKQTKLERYKKKVLSRYDVYNNVFLTLPFESINDTGRLLPLFANFCKDGFNKNLSPLKIVNDFFNKHCKNLKTSDRNVLIFRFIQYIERQVVLFDAIEDASFAEIHNMNGIGTLRNMIDISENSNSKLELSNLLKRINIKPVLTAHPTQFYPGSVLGIITDLSKAINDNNLNEIKGLLAQLGKTPFFKKIKPTPYDEAVSLTWYLENIFYNSISNIQKYIKSNIGDKNFVNHDLITLGFWPGGDRDGNPFVTNEITIKTAYKLRSDILKNYYRDVRKLRRRLTFKKIEEIIIDVENRLYISMTRDVVKPSISLDELKDKLRYVKNQIVKKHESLFVDQVQDLIDKIDIFGYHFASLDIRQDSSIHDKVFYKILTLIFDRNTANKYKLMNDDEKISFISKVNFANKKKLYSDKDLSNTLGSIEAMKLIQKSNGVDGSHRYIISHNQSPLNILEVYNMFLFNGWTQPSVDIVPLFETIDDLKISESVMDKVYKNKSYKNHLKRRNKKQIIMLGFSDGTKDGGYFTANWNILMAKEGLIRVSKKYGIEVKFFDGRGGPPARGGGNTHQFYSSMAGIIDTQVIQLTIQGQTISSNFGTVDSCQYNLEQLISSAVKKSDIKHLEANLSDVNRKTMDRLSELSFKAYTDFKNHPKFLGYLEKMSTIKYYSKTNIGSRPSKRPSESDNFTIDNLRAIPFVGGWSQLKQNVPGFYGLGTALNHFKLNGQFDKIEKLYKEVPFFRTLISNSMMSLKKSFFGLTSYIKRDNEYSKFWELIFNEFELSKNMVLRVTGYNQLMESEPANKASIEKREEIILPLFTLQQYAIQRKNLLKQKDNNSNNEINVLEKIITRTLFGNINASRNSA